MLLLAVLVAMASAAVLPKKMTAVEVVSGILPCQPPDFTCVGVKRISTPVPGNGQVLVRLTSSSVNPSDLDLEEVLGRLVGTMGADVAGHVVSVGSGVTRLKVGDLVWGDARHAYAEFVAMDEATTGLAPSTLSPQVAGTIPEVGQTSLQCLQALGAPWTLESNVTVVITSGSGGTGFVGIQLARALGAGTVITATSKDNTAFVKSLGADVVVDYKTTDVLASLADGSVDFVFDNYGAVGNADKAQPKLRAGGRYLILPGGAKGKLSKNWTRTDATQVDAGLMKPSLQSLDALKGMFEAGKIVAHIDSTFAFHNASAALARSATGQSVGKIALVPDS